MGRARGRSQQLRDAAPPFGPSQRVLWRACVLSSSDGCGTCTRETGLNAPAAQSRQERPECSLRFSPFCFSLPCTASSTSRAATHCARRCWRPCLPPRRCFCVRRAVRTRLLAAFRQEECHSALSRTPSLLNDADVAKLEAPPSRRSLTSMPPRARLLSLRRAGFFVWLVLPLGMSADVIIASCEKEETPVRQAARRVLGSKSRAAVLGGRPRGLAQRARSWAARSKTRPGPV